LAVGDQSDTRHLQLDFPEYAALARAVLALPRRADALIGWLRANGISRL
jgi:hypothetical protein